MQVIKLFLITDSPSGFTIKTLQVVCQIPPTMDPRGNREGRRVCVKLFPSSHLRVCYNSTAQEWLFISALTFGSHSIFTQNQILTEPWRFLHHPGSIPPRDYYRCRQTSSPFRDVVLKCMKSPIYTINFWKVLFFSCNFPIP